MFREVSNHYYHHRHLKQSVLPTTDMYKMYNFFNNHQFLRNSYILTRAVFHLFDHVRTFHVFY